MMRRTLFAVALSVIFTWPAAAQQPVTVSFHNDGRVSVEATSATVRSILNEWSKNGGTKVIGAERVSGAPVTIKLVNVPEAQALETILRSVAGYMAAPRHASTGPSAYDRILIMATSSAPPPAMSNRPTTTVNNSFSGTQRFIPPRNREQAEPDDQEEPDDNPPNPPVFTFPQPGQQNGFNPAGFNPAGFNQPGMINTAPGQVQPAVINPTQPYQPGMPIGVSTPGMMVQPPQPQTPTTPTTMIRPPGSNQ